MTLYASGGTKSYVWAIESGTLPSGLTLASGKISGTPTVSGSQTLVVRVTDTAGRTAISGPLTIYVAPKLAILTATLPGATKGAAYSFTLNAEGGLGPYTWSKSSGTIPSGLTLSSAGVLSGTPTASGTFSMTVKIADKNRKSATRTFSLVVSR
jgi:hypothetical protein